MLSMRPVTLIEIVVALLQNLQCALSSDIMIIIMVGKYGYLQHYIENYVRLARPLVSV